MESTGPTPREPNSAPSSAGGSIIFRLDAEAPHAAPRLIELNCGSFESTLESVSGLLGIGTSELCESLLQFDIDQAVPPHVGWSGYPGGLVLGRLLGNRRLHSQFARTRWFHLTRTHDHRSFLDGILPLGHCVDLLWERLYALVKTEVSPEAWQRARRALEAGGGGHLANLYRSKLSDRLHWGPNAMLVRDSAFRAASMGNHDYLAIPEVIEDVCASVSVPEGVDLRRRFVESSRPCIVEFATPGSRQEHLESALYYIYCVLHEMPMNPNANYCWDGAGRAVHRSQLLSIEVLTDPASWPAKRPGAQFA